MHRFRQLIILLLLSVALINAAFSWGCDGDVPWDPCGVLTSDSVPDNEADAKIYFDNVPETAKKIHSSPLTINSIDQMGLLGDYTEKSKNGAALELLMWESGFHLPTRQITYTEPYKSSDFYSGKYGNNFEMFVLPFDYAKGWGRCQFLKFTPTEAQTSKANKILSAFDNFIKVITTPYENKSADKETPQELIDRQTQFNTRLKDAVTNFHYDEYMSYARAELDRYLQAQLATYYVGKGYANWGCKKEVVGKTLVY